MVTAITNARVFDGERVRAETTVLLDGTRIAAIGGEPPAGADVVDASGATLMPGLIDSHVHTSEDGLALALRFGVTTELEMQGMYTKSFREHVLGDDSVADVRSSGFGITPPGGHPSELLPEDFEPGGHGEPDAGEPDSGDSGHGGQQAHGPAPLMPFSSTPAEAVGFIPQLIAAGSDYIKFMVDDGSVEGHPGLPMLDQATLTAGVAEAHRHGMLTIAHTLTVEATRMAIEAGIDGFAHLFMDQPHTDEIIGLIAASGAFVAPCVVLNASMTGITGSDLADDPRVGSRLTPAWSETLRSSYDRYPQGKLEDVLASVKALHDAGVDLLAGTDAAPMPLPFLGGMIHGASVHHELQYLVRAGLTPVQALRAATLTPARRFGLTDRGRIAEGLRADLLLVDGDPTTTIADTLNLRAVWRRGTLTRLAA
ncbi:MULTISPECIES: amidohydrolase family protein [Streptomyces]|uniref:Amidohydrolase family protein n=1 Tax=Streptomyces glycanivorans TaxID=3033808 RepID=A0ABY9JA98_9ACTN|nr:MULTISPECIES: amidohydrolase family protein [unclassified Streptomyces]WSQ78099.1 amidohydrolase family protein [Streptomyces sp. NBC_01213]TXS17571.1 amidohydrolase family protein [Streptomyces sp. wa22]WLQ64716.1 amidohydrolase family protein [Streptomyces sp. Alt3]WSQ85471.1 amidohydrolase family protein [Streptomyces sp. NBC_01212]WSR08438.1 amidohydrolase family protein [Streptomyces sp. NBC_01208]